MTRSVLLVLILALSVPLAAVGQPAGKIARIGVLSGTGPLYGPHIWDGCERAASYVHRILNGAKPTELPVEQPTRVELIINLKTARALGITIPPALLARAAQVME